MKTDMFFGVGLGRGIQVAVLLLPIFFIHLHSAKRIENDAVISNAGPATNTTQ